MAKPSEYTPEERESIQKVAEAIQDALRNVGWSSDDGMLVKAAIVAHYTDVDQDHQIIRFGATLDGLEPTSWDIRGLLFDALFVQGSGYEDEN